MAIAQAGAYRAAATTVLANYPDYHTAVADEIAAHGVGNLAQLATVAAGAMQPALDNYRTQLFLARNTINAAQAAGVAHYNQAFLNRLNGFAATMALNAGTPQEVLVFEAVYVAGIQDLFDVYNMGYSYDRQFAIGVITAASLLALLALAIKKKNEGTGSGTGSGSGNKPSGGGGSSAVVNPGSLSPWPNRTDLAPGTRIAIRLRNVMVDYQGNSVSWPKYIGVSAADNTTIDAVDTQLTDRNIFTAETFHPSGQQFYDLPWFKMLASNGKYVGGSNDGRGKLVASYDLQNAGMFGRGWNANEASQFMLSAVPWAQAQSWLTQVIQQGNYYKLPLSPFTLGTQNITQWLSGPAPNYGAYMSADVDFFTVV